MASTRDQRRSTYANDSAGRQREICPSNTGDPAFHFPPNKLPNPGKCRKSPHAYALLMVATTSKYPHTRKRASNVVFTSANSIFHSSRIASTSDLLLSCPQIPTRKLTHPDRISGVIFPSTGKCLGHSSGKIETVSGTVRTREVVMVALYKAYAGQRKQTRDENGGAGMDMRSCQCQCQTQRGTALVSYLCVFRLCLPLVMLVMLVMLAQLENYDGILPCGLSDTVGRYFRNVSTELSFSKFPQPRAKTSSSLPLLL